MGLMEIASGKSVWRGIDYYEAKRVISWEKVGDEAYSGIVSGSEDNIYNVHIDKAHPRKSTCDCPFAKGRRVICKHMLALYFTVEPKVAEDFLNEVEKWEAEEEERMVQHYEDLKKYVKTLSKKELQDQLFDALIELEERRNYY